MQHLVRQLFWKNLCWFNIVIGGGRLLFRSLPLPNLCVEKFYLLRQLRKTLCGGCYPFNYWRLLTLWLTCMSILVGLILLINVPGVDISCHQLGEEYNLDSRYITYMGQYITYISVLHLYIRPPNWNIAYILSTSQFLESLYKVLCKNIAFMGCTVPSKKSIYPSFTYISVPQTDI